MLKCFIRDHPICLWGTNYVFHSRRAHLHRKSGRAREIPRHHAPATSSLAMRCQAHFTDCTALLIDGRFIMWLPLSGLQLRQKTVKKMQAQILHKQHIYVHVNVGLGRWAGFNQSINKKKKDDYMLFYFVLWNLFSVAGELWWRAAEPTFLSTVSILFHMICIKMSMFEGFSSPNTLALWNIHHRCCRFASKL